MSLAKKHLDGTMIQGIACAEQEPRRPYASGAVLSRISVGGGGLGMTWREEGSEMLSA
jgi:hypothetical protein